MIQLFPQGGECMEKDQKKQKHANWSRGNIMLLTAILLLILSVVVMTCMNVSGMQMKLASMERNTSNTYYMGEAGIEKEVETINKALEMELPHIVETIGKKYLNNNSEGQGLIADSEANQRAADAKGDTNKYAHIRYGNEDPTDTTLAHSKLMIQENALSSQKEKQKDMHTLMTEAIFEFLEQYYLVDENNEDGPKPLVYQGQSDRQTAGAVTTITITPSAIKDKKGKITTQSQIQLDTFVETSVTKSGSKEILDQQKLQTIVSIDVPDTKDLEAEIHEYYEWVDENNSSELLSSPLTCFGDLVIDGTGNSLTVSSGDVQVKGLKQESVSTDEGTRGIVDVDENGGVLVMNGGKLDIADSLYCISNVVASNGWQDTPRPDDYNHQTMLQVGGDIIASTIGLVDDYYSGSPNQAIARKEYKGSNLKINVSKNAIVDNDVMIDRNIYHDMLVEEGDIMISGTLFGLSGGTEDTGNEILVNGKKVVDPNNSSGVYSQGENTVIAAGRMFVGGQPYITLRADRWPLKLFESIGEPFDGITSWKEYAKDEPDPAKLNDNGRDYLESTSSLYSLIKGNKIKTDIKNSYAIEKISAMDTSEGNAEKVGVEGGFAGMDDIKLWQFLYQGGSSFSMADFLVNEGMNNGYEETDYLLSDDGILNYYNGDTHYLGYPKMFFKKFGVFNAEGKIRDNAGRDSHFNAFKGLKGYATAMRSVFYGKFKVTAAEDGTSDAVVREQVLSFGDVVDLGKIKNKEDKSINSWSYQTPIIVVDGSKAEDMTMDVKDFYVTTGAAQEAQPTIIINTNVNQTLTLKATTDEQNEFKGVIISAGPVILKQEGMADALKITGSIIAGEPNIESNLSNREIFKQHLSQGLSVQGKVSVSADQNMLFAIDASDRVLYRSILDALHLTQYSKTSGVGINEKIATILGPYKDDDVGVEYTMGKVAYSEQSYLSMRTEGIYLRIESQKQIS